MPRTMAFMVLVISQLFYSMAVRSNSKSVFSIGLLSNKYLAASIVLGILLQLIVIGVPLMQRAFNLRMLDAKGWSVALSLGLIPLLLNEVYKILFRAFRGKQLLLSGGPDKA